MDEQQNVAANPDYIGANDIVRKGARRMGDLVGEDPAPPIEELRRLSGPQRLALEAIFKGRTAGDAARKAGVSRSTLYRWQQEDGKFRQLLRGWQRQTQRSREDRMRTLGDLAINNIYVALLNGNVGPSLALVKILASQDRRARRRKGKTAKAVAGGGEREKGREGADQSASDGISASGEQMLVEQPGHLPRDSVASFPGRERDQDPNAAILEENRGFVA